MSLIWKYKIDVKNADCFKNIEKMTKTVIPEELQNLFMVANGASPDKNAIDVNGNERVFAAVLSVNEEDLDDIYTSLEIVKQKNVIPFGRDPFGNYYCYHVKNKKVLFWDHELQKFERTNYDLESFFDSLYE